MSTKSTEQDKVKLERVLGYLLGTKDLKMKISNKDGGIPLETYIDASFASHHDAKGHSGCVVF